MRMSAPTLTAACPVAELERQMLAAMDAGDAAQHKLFVDPASPARAIIEAEAKVASDRMEAMQEMATHVAATSKAGLVYQMIELKCAAGHLHDNLPSIEDDGFGPLARKVERLIEMIGQGILNTVPDASAIAV